MCHGSEVHVRTGCIFREFTKPEPRVQYTVSLKRNQNAESRCLLSYIQYSGGLQYTVC